MRGPPVEENPAHPGQGGGVFENATDQRDQPINTAAAAELQEDDDDRDFDWVAGDANVVIREQPTTAVYTNPFGQVVIRQQTWPQDDVWVIVGPEHVAAVIKAMLDAAGIEPATMFSDGAVEAAPRSPADPTAAERQRRYRERKRA
jgi:hypothetical protein